MGQNWGVNRFTPTITASTTSPTYTPKTDIPADWVVPNTFGLWWNINAFEVGVLWRTRIDTISDVGSGNYLFNLPVPPMLGVPQPIGPGMILDVSAGGDRAVATAYSDPAYSLTHAVLFIDPDPTASGRPDFGNGEVVATHAIPYTPGDGDIFIFKGSYLRAL